MTTDSTSSPFPLTVKLGFVYEPNTLNSSNNVAITIAGENSKSVVARNTYYLLGVIVYGFTEKA